MNIETVFYILQHRKFSILLQGVKVRKLKTFLERCVQLPIQNDCSLGTKQKGINNGRFLLRWL